MLILKKLFATNNNINLNFLNTLIESKIIPIEKIGNKILIDENSINSLIKNKDFVECPICFEKMSCVTKCHYKHCGDANQPPLYSEFYLNNHKKTEEEKRHQSETLKKRFQTPAGEETRKIIGKASKNFNADPDFKIKKRATSLEINNRPENKKLSSEKFKKMWADPEFQDRMSNYVDNNIEKLKESARNARKFLKKQSKLHIAYKKTMLDHNIKGFISEYAYGPYSLDEADPLAKIAIEIDGCYWHGCSECGYPGDTRIINIDTRKNSYLKNRNWIVIRIKEHDIKKDPIILIDKIINLQKEQRLINSKKIKEAFDQKKLMVRAMVKESDTPVWRPVTDLLRHNTPNKKIIKIETILGSVKVTEDHSLFKWEDKEPVVASNLKPGDLIVGAPWEKFEPLQILSLEIMSPEETTYDLSVPDAENAVLDSGILVHNSYSISGVSLDIDKSSKYQSMKQNFESEYDKAKEGIKRSIKITKGLKQPRYGIGVSSALGPYSRPGVQSRRNFTSGTRGGWS